MKDRLPLRSLGRLAFSVVLLTGALLAFMNLPGIPYNVREIFGSGFALHKPVVFALALLWIGFGSSVAADVLDGSRFRFLTILACAAPAGLVSFLLVNLAVTGESMRDIVGSPTIWRDAVILRIWGEDIANTLPTLTSRYVVSQIEYAGRYIALYSPIVLLLVVLNSGRQQPPAERLRSVGVAFAYALPWLYLCKYIVIDLAGTDNLTELIAPPGAFGIGGEAYIFLLLVVLALTATLVAHAMQDGRPFWKPAMATFVAGVPLSWILLKNGLAAHLPKYNARVSAVDFLLSQDRNTFLPQWELFLRWSVAFTGLVLILALGLAMHRRRPD